MGSTGAYHFQRRLTEAYIGAGGGRHQSILTYVPSGPNSRHNSKSMGSSRRQSITPLVPPFFEPSVGRVKWDQALSDDSSDAVTDDDSGRTRETVLQKTAKYLKILLPHVGLNILLLSYITFGAIVFIFLEASSELEERQTKLQAILNLYGLVINETSAICSAASGGAVRVDPATVERRIRPLLRVLSRTHEFDDRFTPEAQMWTDSEAELHTKWTFAAASLYALTVITSTGYDHLTPSTDAGRIFTVFYGLLGIPLMFITAADIGKFLSDLVIRFYGKLLALFAWIASVVDAIKDYIVEPDDESLDSRCLRQSRRRRRRMLEGGGGDDDDDPDDERLQLPIVSYFALVVGYCAVGSLLFNWWEKGAVWSFIHGLFFSFNTITTIGLGNICVRSKLYLALTVMYVIIGLAVITASLDLCSSTLKRTFTKLHYFGRKIRGARGRFANVSDDIREAMKIVAALKKTRPSKERITLDDLKRFLEVQEQLLRQPYVPYNVHIFKWIEDAYAQYFIDDRESMTGRSQLKPSPSPNVFAQMNNAINSNNNNNEMMSLHKTTSAGQDSILLF